MVRTTPLQWGSAAWSCNHNYSSLGSHSIPLRRANIQGDGLLPLLFPPFLQPLLHSQRQGILVRLSAMLPFMQMPWLHPITLLCYLAFLSSHRSNWIQSKILQIGQASGSHHLEVWHQAQSSCKQADCAVHWGRSSGLLAVLTV